MVDAPLDEWRRMVELNLLGLLYVAHAALPHLLTAADTVRAGWRTWSTSAPSPVGWPAAGSGVYNATKFGLGALSESLRQEVTKRHVRVCLVEPGAVATELASHNRPQVLEGLQDRFSGMELLQSEDIADAMTTPSRARGTSR